MSASRPPLGHHSPALVSGRRSPATPRSPPLSTEDRLLRLLDLDDRNDTDSEDEFSLLKAPSVSGSISRSTTRGMTARSAVPSEGTSPVPVSATPVRTGGGIAGRGVLGGLGVLGGAGNVPPQEQALRALVQSSPRKRILLRRFIHSRTQTSLKDVFSALIAEDIFLFYNNNILTTPGRYFVKYYRRHSNLPPSAFRRDETTTTAAAPASSRTSD
jgi:hypothetical protein